jgi:ribosome-interacting GTPase 1
MPTNLPAEWALVEKEYRDVKDLDKKIEALKRLISVTPRHKGCENLLADLRRKLSKLEDQLEKKSKKSGRKKDVIKKTGDIMVSIVGLTQSGKSTLLKTLTNASAEIGYREYTTKEPITGVAFFEGVDIQFVEIPSFFLKNHMNIVHGSDLVLLLARNQIELDKLENILKENRIEKRKIVLEKVKDLDQSGLLNQIIRESGIVRIFTKPIGRPVEKKAVVLKKGSVVKDLIERINHIWLKNFNFARIFDDTRFSGRKVGLEYVLKDKDKVEIHVL